MKIQKRGVDHKHNDTDVGHMRYVVDIDMMEDAHGDTKKTRRGWENTHRHIQTWVHTQALARVHKYMYV